MAGVSSGDAFANGVGVPRLRLDPASDVASGPALPERPARAPGFGAGACSRTALIPWWADVADRDDRGFLAVDDSPVAAAGALAPLRCGKCVTRPAAVAAETRENANCAVAAQK